MERKTMGTFIAALRKSKGYTQKQLAEMLAVSDKTVSHWERDESAPDISLIPVIAEIFSVTCDELIKGEKKADSEPFSQGAFSKKSEKQLRFLLDKRLAKFKIQAIISLAIEGVGFAFAIFVYWNFAWSPFYIQLVFTVAALCCLAAFNILFKQSLSAGEAEEEIIASFLLKGKKLCLTAFILILAFQSFTFPDAVNWSFMPGGIIFSLTVLAVGFALMMISGWGEDVGIIKRINIKLWLIRLCAAVLCFALVFASAVVTDNAKSRFFANQQSSLTFTDKDEFIAYMEEEKPMPHYSESMSVTQRVDETFDMDGYVVRDEEYGYPDGERELKLNFTWRNLTVSDYYIDMRSDGYIIEVVTFADINARQEYCQRMDIIFYISIPVSVVLSFAFYKIFRKKIR